MSIIVLLIFIAAITKKTNGDRRRGDLFKKVIAAYIGISVLAGLLSSGGFVPVAVIGWLIWYYYNKKQKKEKNSWQEAYEQAKYRPQEDVNRRQDGQTYQQQSFADQNRANRTGGRFSQTQTQPDPMSRMESVLLARPLAKRKKVIQEFNLKYRLTLTDAEVNRIAEASYVSEGWKKEAEAMTRKYDTIGQWFQGPTGWLRVYIYVFQIQNISSDFALQKQICIEALDEVIAYGCAPAGMTIEERVQNINNRYFTYFDEMTFLIAWRFLEQEGRVHELSQPDLVRNVDEDLDELERKYRTG